MQKLPYLEVKSGNISYLWYSERGKERDKGLLKHNSE